MTMRDFEVERDTSTPIDMLEHYFNAHGWAYERAADEEIVANVQGSWAQYELRAVWRDDDHVLQFLALPDIRVPADKRPAIYEAIGLINEQLWIGHFEMWAAAVLVLAVKPQLLDAVAPALTGLLAPETLILSILAGVEIASLRDRLSKPRGIIRAMPNTPASIRKGVTALYPSEADEVQRERAE